MAKKTYVDVIGLKKGEAPEIIATFSNRTIANWHIKNTFDGEGYDNLIAATTKKKGDKFVQDTVADDKDTYIEALSTMKITNMDEVITVTSKGTLLGYILKGVIKNKTGVEEGDINYEELQEEVSS
jgi:hypothetical protein